MLTLADVLTLFAVLSAVQFTARSLRNLRDATRLVPIGSVTPPMVREHKTVPLCFIGGETLLGSVVTYFFGKLWIGPRARKQAALCNQIVFLDRDNTPLDTGGPVVAGTVVQVVVSEGEDWRHIRRSARRCRRGTELVLAMLFPTASGERYTTQIRCVAVRSRARSVWDIPDGEELTRVIEWEVIDPVGLRMSTDVSLERHQVPLSAFWLVSNVEHDEGRPARQRFGRVAYAYGSNKVRGLVAWCVTTTARLFLITAGVVGVGVVVGVTTNYLPAQFSLVVLQAAAFLFLVMVLQAAVFLLWYKITLCGVRLITAAMRSSPQRPTGIGDGRPGSAAHRSPWHGAARRSLAVGDQIRRVTFWQRLHFQCWEPFVVWPWRALCEWTRGRVTYWGSSSARDD